MRNVVQCLCLRCFALLVKYRNKLTTLVFLYHSFLTRLLAKFKCACRDLFLSTKLVDSIVSCFWLRAYRPVFNLVDRLRTYF